MRRHHSRPEPPGSHGYSWPGAQGQGESGSRSPCPLQVHVQTGEEILSFINQFELRLSL